MTLATIDIEPTLEQLMIHLNELPELPYQRKNIFQIAGFPRWENVNSNMLAFYFDKNQEHGFNTLFLESLLELIKGQTDLAESDYEVYREYQYVDILIAAKNTEETENTEGIFDWAIIIENKIYHDLKNNLKEYWNRVLVKEGGAKIGVVISPDGHIESLRTIYKKNKNGEKEIITTFFDVTHKKLTDQIQQNLSKIYLNADDRHLLLLKDYIDNIESMHMNDDEQQSKNTKLTIFQNNADEIKRILTLNTEVRQFVLEETIKEMHKFGYEPTNAYFSSTGKHFSKKKEGQEPLEKDNTEINIKVPEYFRIYIWYPSLVEYQELNFYFELHEKYIRYGDQLHNDKTLQDIVKSEKHTFARLDKSKGKDYYRLVHYKDPSFRNFDSTKTFSGLFRKVMNDHFFNKQNGLLWKCAERLEIIIAEENKK